MYTFICSALTIGPSGVSCRVDISVTDKLNPLCVTNEIHLNKHTPGPVVSLCFISRSPKRKRKPTFPSLFFFFCSFIHSSFFPFSFCLHFIVWCLKELKLKDEECERLSKVRDQLGQELEELTASLFEVCFYSFDLRCWFFLCFSGCVYQDTELLNSGIAHLQLYIIHFQQARMSINDKSCLIIVKMLVIIAVLDFIIKNHLPDLGKETI